MNHLTLSVSYGLKLNCKPRFMVSVFQEAMQPDGHPDSTDSTITFPPVNSAYMSIYTNHEISLRIFIEAKYDYYFNCNIIKCLGILWF